MDVILQQSENQIGLYIDHKLATVFKNKTMDQVVDWIGKNLKGAKIHIIK